MGCLERYGLVQGIEPLPWRAKTYASEMNPGVSVACLPAWRLGTSVHRGGDERLA